MRAALRRRGFYSSPPSTDSEGPDDADRRATPEETMHLLQEPEKEWREYRLNERGEHVWQDRQGRWRNQQVKNAKAPAPSTMTDPIPWPSQ